MMRASPERGPEQLNQLSEVEPGPSRSLHRREVGYDEEVRLHRLGLRVAEAVAREEAVQLVGGGRSIAQLSLGRLFQVIDGLDDLGAGRSVGAKGHLLAGAAEKGTRL
jgi:hypothetical protein